LEGNPGALIMDLGGTGREYLRAGFAKNVPDRGGGEGWIPDHGIFSVAL